MFSISKFLYKYKGISSYNKNLITLISGINLLSLKLNKQNKIWFYLTLYRLVLSLNNNLIKKEILNKKSFLDLKLVKGIRLKNNLPIKGQRTKTNSKTALKLNKIILD
uniref:30S ribosomal protein S13 n=1 Tax=Nephromyces sp. ex Molgula occidentalis TaxID=2544991 RepID=A0A5C1H830_9APIC|nr:30S ribosomal protein S13 [Nephromyces sp. ex Molgula occidentalis]